MPVEIMELVIKARVGDGQQDSSDNNRPPASRQNGQDKARIKALERSVLETLEIIKRKNER
ncbi:MAG: hypothetical protein J5I98_21360 [Phaeodactylibacter sp.]|nr:hypothetical protein [Phaeodactylibacter sp.]